jgi:hypothetical protein
VQLQLVQQTSRQHLAQQRPATCDGDVLATGRAPRQLDGSLEPIGDERERGATVALEHLAGPVGHDEHRRVERWVVAPRDLTGGEHAATHDVGAGSGEGLLDDLRAHRALTPGEPLPLAPGHGVDGPPGHPEEARRFRTLHPPLHVGAVARIPGTRVAAIERDRHLRGDLGHHVLLSSAATGRAPYP